MNARTKVRDLDRAVSTHLHDHQIRHRRTGRIIHKRRLRNRFIRRINPRIPRTRGTQRRDINRHRRKTLRGQTPTPTNRNRQRLTRPHHTRPRRHTINRRRPSTRISQPHRRHRRHRRASRHNITRRHTRPRRRRITRPRPRIPRRNTMTQIIHRQHIISRRLT